MTNNDNHRIFLKTGMCVGNGKKIITAVFCGYLKIGARKIPLLRHEYTV